jgi:hypothetical protein
MGSMNPRRDIRVVTGGGERVPKVTVALDGLLDIAHQIRTGRSR